MVYSYVSDNEGLCGDLVSVGWDYGEYTGTSYDTSNTNLGNACPSPPPPPICAACIEVQGDYVACLASPASCTRLDMSGGQMTGTIPTGLGLLTALTALNVCYNDLNGPIPTEVGLLTALTDVTIRLNSLSGPIPTEMGELTALTTL